MARKSPFHIELSAEESAELNRRATRYTLPYFEVIRARMILMAAKGIGNDEIAARLDTRREGGQPVAPALLQGAIGGPRRESPPRTPPGFSPQSS